MASMFISKVCAVNILLNSENRLFDFSHWFFSTFQMLKLTKCTCKCIKMISIVSICEIFFYQIVANELATIDLSPQYDRIFSHKSRFFHSPLRSEFVVNETCCADCESTYFPSSFTIKSSVKRLTYLPDLVVEKFSKFLKKLNRFLYRWMIVFSVLASTNNIRLQCRAADQTVCTFSPTEVSLNQRWLLRLPDAN